MNDAILLIDGSHGQYIPQMFAEQYRRHTRDVPEECWADLLAGPYEDGYHDAWDMVLNMATIVNAHGDRFTLYQDMDLWAIPEGAEIPEGF